MQNGGILWEPVWLERFLPLLSPLPIPKKSGDRERTDRLSALTSGQARLEWRRRLADERRHRGMHELAAADVDALRERRIGPSRASDAAVGQLKHVRQGGVGQGKRRG